MPRILIVEDEPLISEMLCDWVIELGHEVAGPADCVDSALAVVIGEVQALVGAILDVTLRDGDSYPIADELLRRGIPFAFATGLGAQALAPRFQNATTLMKPFVFDDLQATLTQMLRSACAAKDA